MNNTENNYLLAGPIIKKSFLLARKYFWYFLLVIFLFGIIFLLFFVKIIILNILAFLLMFYFSTTLSNALLNLVRKGNLQVSNFFIWPKNGFRAILTSIVSLLIIALPFIFLILLSFGFSSFLKDQKEMSIFLTLVMFLGIMILYLISGYITLCVMFSKMISLEEGLNPIKSIKKSFKGVKGNKINILAIFLALMILMEFFVFLTLGIGIFWAIPTVLIAQVYIYTLLSPKQNNNSNTTIEIQPTEIPAHTITNETVVENNINNTNI